MELSGNAYWLFYFESISMSSLFPIMLGTNGWEVAGLKALPPILKEDWFESDLDLEVGFD